MIITQKKLNKIYKVDDDLTAVREKLEKWTVKINLKEELGKTRKIIRDKKEIEIENRDLWAEVRNGVKESTELLKKDYPEFFELADKEEKLIKKYNEIKVKDFGLRGKAVSIADILRMMEAMIKKNE